jgi:hypothetical protein
LPTDVPPTWATGPRRRQEDLEKSAINQAQPCSNPKNMVSFTKIDTYRNGTIYHNCLNRNLPFYFEGVAILYIYYIKLYILQYYDCISIYIIYIFYCCLRHGILHYVYMHMYSMYLYIYIYVCVYIHIYIHIYSPDIC